MGKVIGLIQSIIKRCGTKISPLAILHDVNYDATAAIKPLAKLERSTIGKCTYVGTMAAVYDCSIGSFCSIARDAYVGGAKHPTEWVTTSPCFHLKDNATGICYAENEFDWKERTCVGNDVWIGERATILSGLSIGDGAIIGGGSVVTKNVGAYEIWAGNPARFIRKRFDDETISKLEKVQWWDLGDTDLVKIGSLMTNVDSFLKAVEQTEKGIHNNGC